MSEYDYDSEEWREYLDECKQEFFEYERAENSAHRDIDVIHFVSQSKGKGRKRKNPVEVILIRYRYWNNKYTSWHKFPFDTVATEIYADNYQQQSGLDLESRLMAEIEGLARQYYHQHSA